MGLLRAPSGRSSCTSNALQNASGVSSTLSESFLASKRSCMSASGNEHVALLAIFPKCDKMSSYSLPQLSHRVACSKVSSEPRDIARVKTFARSKLPTTSFFTCRGRDLSMRLRWPVSAGQLGTLALFIFVDKHVVRPRALV